MKKHVLLALLFVSFVVSYSWAHGPWKQRGNQGQNQSVASVATSMPYQDVSEEEKAGLVWMREEEKLARDVYLTLYEKWHIPIFQNISHSEQTHMDAVKALLDKYNIPDPVQDDSVGAFTNEELGALYEQLVALGSQSVVDALTVGATIEDLDIKDLEERIAMTDNEDIQTVYSSLMCGSRNHMRSFVSLLRGYGADYEPQYISEDEFEDILESDMEFCGVGMSPTVDIKINGEDDDVVLSDDDTLTLTVSTILPGQDVFASGYGPMNDLFLWVELPNGAILSWKVGNTWEVGHHAAYTGPVPLIMNYPLIEVPASLLPKGVYRVHFATDLNPNGVLDDEYFEDTVDFIVN